MSFRSTRWFLGMAVGGAMVGAITLGANSALAQITPDATLPNNSTVRLDGNTHIIENGTQRGGNLFHSFKEFSVPTGGTAFFNNAADIQNIFSRVTGGSRSEINGLIKANGANLFLINPSGIIFGKNARLDIGGSFVASTASSLKFADGFEFSANAPQTTPLLTISVPIGLQYGENPGLIQVQGDGQGLRSTTELIDTTSGLRVQPNQTLALVGGDVSLEGATLKTAGGRIELGSVTGVGLVSLTPISKGFSLGYDKVQNFGNIQLSQQAAVDASGTGGGDIQVVGSRVTLNNSSQIEASTLGADKGGAMVVKATELLEIIGISAEGSKLSNSSLSTQAYPRTTGDAGDLTIKTNTLLVKDGAQVSTITFGSGKSGNLTVNALDVQLIGNGIGISPNDNTKFTFPSSLATNADRSSTGNAGDLTIKTNTLLVKDGAQVSASTFGSGKGGDLTIKTNTLQVRDGAQVYASTFGSGKGGNLRVDASDVQLIGTNDHFASALAANADRRSTGNAGDLTIKTNTLLVKDGAAVTVANLSTGTAGNMTVNARSIRLDNGTLNANTRNNSTNPNQEQATITLHSGDLILSHGSKITTSATGSNVIGGNINIDTAVLAAVQNSHIRADSKDFQGGRVKINNTQGVFLSSDSDITASGANPQLNGTVQINIGSTLGQPEV